MHHRIIISAFAAALCTGCGGGGGTSATPTVSATTSSPSNAASNAYAAAYQSVKWGSEVSVSYPSSCSMTYSTTGVPPYHADYYLAPAGGSGTVVAHTPISNMAMMLQAYSASNIATGTATINTCPTKAASTTPTNMGPIGYTIAGEAIFNPYEATGQAALADNVSYSFTASGVAETASFIDSCNSHPAGMGGESLWHYHGVPSCLTSQLDGNGPSHILGFALDGFPIYGGRDINGNVISVSQLDACNGITSATPEFPNGAYHYVLPIGVTDSHSSLNCYAGTAL